MVDLVKRLSPVSCLGRIYKEGNTKVAFYYYHLQIGFFVTSSSFNFLSKKRKKKKMKNEKGTQWKKNCKIEKSREKEKKRKKVGNRSVWRVLYVLDFHDLTHF